MAKTEGETPTGESEPTGSTETSAASAVRATIDGGVRRLVGSIPALRQGEAEGVHQIRTAARRLRSDLRTFRPLLDAEWTEVIRDELWWLGQRLGAVRDLDVIRKRLEADAGDDKAILEPLFARLVDQRKHAFAALIDTVDSNRFGDLVGRLIAFERAEVITAEAHETTTAEALPPLMSEAWEHLARPARKLDDDDPPDAVHDVRKRAKRLRYAAEAIAPLLDPDHCEAGQAFAKTVEKVQDRLGTYHDGIVAAETVRRLAAELQGDDLKRAAEALAGRQLTEAKEARDDFPGIWRKLDRGKRRKWFE